MFDSTIHSHTIARHFRKSDFESKVWSATKDDRPAIIRSATRLASNGFTSVSLKRNEIGTKPIYRHADLAEALLIRHVSDNVRRVTGVKQSDRHSIVKSLSNMLAEGVPFTVIKSDIKSFYESVRSSDIVKKLEQDAAFSRQSISVLKSFFSSLQQQQISGLPRGIGLSATLSEYLMRDFDSTVSNVGGVKFYSRYVDDIIILASPDVSIDAIMSQICGSLPIGLSLNRTKTKTYLFKPHSSRSSGKIENCLSFLGYDFSVSEVISDERTLLRAVGVDIARKKVERIKRRFCKALLAYNDGGNFTDFRDRVRILTSNFPYKDELSGQTRYSGLRYNYGLIDPEKSEALKSLDRFVMNVITSKHTNNRIRPNLTLAQRNTILGLGFKSGFINNRFFSFETSRLRTLIGCWAHA